MNHLGTVQIETDRLQLRKFIISDSRALFNNWANDVEVTKSRHDPRNPNSGKVMLKCGLTFEGTLRNADINNQGICDASMYALLKEDYYNLK